MLWKNPQKFFKIPYKVHAWSGKTSSENFFQQFFYNPLKNSLKVLWKISAYIKFPETLGSPVGNLISCGKSARISNDPDGHLEDGEKRFLNPKYDIFVC